MRDQMIGVSWAIAAIIIVWREHHYWKKVNKLQCDLTKLGIEMARENGLLRELAWKRLKEIERLILERQA